MPALYLATFAPEEGPSDEWALFLSGPADTVLCRVEGHYLNYKKTITMSTPDESLKHKESVPLGIIRETDVPHFREILMRIDVNNNASFSNSHPFVRKVLERLESDGILNTQTQQFRNALKWIKQHYDDAGD